MKSDIQVSSLSINDTLALKGIALIMLLCHHCLYTGEIYDDLIIAGKPCFQYLGKFCKLCVAIFVFLSGYGLTIQTNSKGGIPSIWQFYKRRYLKLMTNFWLIWLLFVPLGVFVFNRTFPIAYGEHYIVRACLDLTGLCTSTSYNATWWFYGCIILLYALFPLIWKKRTYWFLLLPASIALPYVLECFPLVNLISDYLFVFACGCIYADNKITFKGGALTSTGLLMIFSYYRFLANNPILWDAAIVIALVYVYSMLSIPSFIKKILTFLGNHSFNVFLFHTFIYLYYFHDFIYWHKNPILIVVTLLLVCIVISICIEKIKKIIKFDFLIKKII